MNRRSIERIGFELLLVGITISPIVYLLISWDAAIVNAAAAVFIYLFTSSIFYFFSVWFVLLDSRKENQALLWASSKQIRLIWAFFVAAVGWVLFYHTMHQYQLDFLRLTGVLLSLFLFASGNFQGRLHPSSAFSGNRWVLSDAKTKFRKSQRNHARFKFWVGIVATLIFLFVAAEQLIIGYFFVAIAIIYGLLFRMIDDFIGKQN